MVAGFAWLTKRCKRRGWRGWDKAIYQFTQPPEKNRAQSTTKSQLCNGDSDGGAQV